MTIEANCSLTYDHLSPVLLLQYKYIRPPIASLNIYGLVCKTVCQGNRATATHCYYSYGVL